MAADTDTTPNLQITHNHEKERPASTSNSDAPSQQDGKPKKRKWRLGMLPDSETDEVPGSVLLLSKVNEYNAPLGLDNDQAHASNSSLPSIISARSQAMFSRRRKVPEKKRTKDGKIILEPQPEESGNDPLNWPVLRRDMALLSLGFYCMVGGGMTPILAAGFTNVAETYDVTIPDVALTTGLYMLGLGLGSVIASPTAIAFGKRPVYLAASLLFVLTSIWCALSPNYPSLVVARIFQGIAVSPVECLPSATIAEIFFLHERAYRLGIYTLLLLGGKNLVPLVSAAIIQSLGWRWVFWIVAIIVGFCFFLLFFFVPETFWDRAPVPHHHRSHRRPSLSAMRRTSGTKASPRLQPQISHADDPTATAEEVFLEQPQVTISGAIATRRRAKRAHFAQDGDPEKALEDDHLTQDAAPLSPASQHSPVEDDLGAQPANQLDVPSPESQPQSPISPRPLSTNTAEPPTPHSLPNTNTTSLDPSTKKQYTPHFRALPPKTFVQTLRPYAGRLNHDNWFRVALRPFILFAYPAILWSATVYALSVGWLIVLSESVSAVYRSADTYNFSAIATGLVYISPFVGGILGTAVAGKVSDVVVRFMARRNDGIYEPEFRLLMALPVALTTAIGLMGFGWSAEERDNFWVPTIFFGLISFGCSLGSTTAITFAVDSYRQYAGEALVTLNFSKNILHGLVFSLFFNRWLEGSGSKDVFVALGGIQIFCLLWTVPMYVFGKRCRMWTVRRRMMERF